MSISGEVIENFLNKVHKLIIFVFSHFLLL